MEHFLFMIKKRLTVITIYYYNIPLFYILFFCYSDLYTVLYLA